MSTTKNLPNNNIYKIGHVMPYPGIGGTEHATLRIAKLAKDAGYENHFFVPNGFDEVALFYKDAGFETHLINEITPSIKQFADYYRGSSKLADLFRETGIDLLHAADYGAAFNISFAAKLAAVPLISHVRNQHKEISSRDKLFLLPVDRWLFVSASTQRDFALKVSDKKAEVVYDGVRIEEITPELKAETRRSVLNEFGLPADTLLVGSLARIAHQKDHLTLAKAAKILLPDLPNLKIMAVGPISREGVDEKNHDDLMSYIDDNGLSNVFIFTGLRGDAQRLVTAFDVHVLSTHFEGLSLVIHEAMCRRTPVIATAVDGLLEAIDDGTGGYLVEHENAGQLAEKMRLLLTDKDLAVKTGDEAYEFAKKNFSSERFQNQMLDIYARMLKK